MFSLISKVYDHPEVNPHPEDYRGNVDSLGHASVMMNQSVTVKDWCRGVETNTNCMFGLHAFSMHVNHKYVWMMDDSSRVS